MKKLEINLDATSLGWSACSECFRLKVVEGYRRAPSAAIVYGQAVHEFVEVMFRTQGQFPAAMREGCRVFNGKKGQPGKYKEYLVDEKHFRSTCYNLWDEYIAKEGAFDVIKIPRNCWWCSGSGEIKGMPCTYCAGDKIVEAPAVEMSFKFPFFESDFLKVNLTGTIDKLGKFQNGCYAIGDWKITSHHEPEKYLEQYKMHRQLRIYALALKKMAILQPDSILGKVGQTRVGAFIDGVFLNKKSNENLYRRSDVEMFSDEQLAEMEALLKDFCWKLSNNVQFNYWLKEGLLNGTCCGKFNEFCEFFYVCRANKAVADVLLGRDFERKHYDPLKFRE